MSISTLRKKNIIVIYLIIVVSRNTKSSQRDDVTDILALQKLNETKNL